MNRQQPPSLYVLTGLNAGAICLLPDSRFSIGSEPPAQILLSDECVMPQHVVIERNENGLQLSIEGPGVRIEGTELPAGNVVAAVLPVTLSIGDVDIRCEGGVGTTPPAWRLAWPFRRIRISALGIGGAMGVALLAGVALLPVATSAFVLPRPAQPSPSRPDPAQQSAEAHTAPLNDATLQAETEQQLQARKLAGLTVRVSSGVVTVQGHLDPASMGRLHEAELWFDRRFGERAVFMSEVSSQVLRKFTIPLDAVWDGPDPNVVIHGQRYYVGSSLPGGASVDQITPHQVLVSQNGQHYAVDY